MTIKANSTLNHLFLDSFFIFLSPLAHSASTQYLSPFSAIKGIRE